MHFFKDFKLKYGIDSKGSEHRLIFFEVVGEMCLFWKSEQSWDTSYTSFRLDFLTQLNVFMIKLQFTCIQQTIILKWVLLLLMGWLIFKDGN